MEETFRLDLNQSWEAIDIKTGHAVIIPKGSHQAIRMLLKGPCDQTEENYLVVTVQHEFDPVLAGLREAYWRQRISDLLAIAKPSRYQTGMLSPCPREPR
jgi:hypothetical protein